MKVASWNANSVEERLLHLPAFLEAVTIMRTGVRNLDLARPTDCKITTW